MKRLVRILVVVAVTIVFLVLPKSQYGVTVSIVSYPSTITLDPFVLTASISGATNNTNYIRVDIYKDGTQNYFDETFNGNDWYGGSDYHQYLPVLISGGMWSGAIQGSLGIPSPFQYDGLGTYRIRIRRYTSGGTYTSSEADNSSVVVNINVPTPTATPTDTPAPTSTPTPTLIPKPTSNPSPTTAVKLISILTTLTTAPISSTPSALVLATSSSVASTASKEEKFPNNRH